MSTTTGRIPTDHAFGLGPKSNESKAVEWLGGNQCNICGEVCDPFLYDAKTAQGPWGVLCDTHFKVLGVGLGLGRGQKYKLQPDGKYIKVEG